MAKSKRELRLVLPAIKRGDDRSPLFWWMLEHHDEIAEAAKRRRPRWKELCERFRQLGLTDGHGEPPSPEAARRTWRNVRGMADAEREARAKQPPPRPGAKYPSRISPNWRPTPTPPPVRVSLPEAAHATDARPEDDDDIAMDEAAKERLARADAQLKRQDDGKFKF